MTREPGGRNRKRTDSPDAVRTIYTHYRLGKLVGSWCNACHRAAAHYCVATAEQQCIRSREGICTTCGRRIK